jgi:ubiquinone/menaquinone biosynthesis C-methylase UbiE
MKLNRIERWVVNNPARACWQGMLIGWMKRKVPLAPGARCLDLGCGRGAGACLIVEAFAPSRLYALDLDIAMIRKARDYLAPKDHDNVSLLVGDALFLPFPDASLDAVFGFGFLHHVVHWRGALSEVARVLKDGGIYFIEELYPALYQNFITKRILVHPPEDRFLSNDLRQELRMVKMPLGDTLELKRFGILGVAVKKG